MNRINTYVVLSLSALLSLFVVITFVGQKVEREPKSLRAPLRIEAYRVDRLPLYGADVYLNQRLIGRTDHEGIFSKDVSLTVGESYTLILEKDRDGYRYGPWETHFRVEQERKSRVRKRRTVEEEGETLEGAFDVLTELERAELGRISQEDKYRFLAIVDGYMYYRVHVVRKDGDAVEDASVLVNDKVEGTTDGEGNVTIHYSGIDERREELQVLKEGEHIWKKTVDVAPDAAFDVNLGNTLLVDLKTFTEMYDTVRGIANATFTVNGRVIAETGENGRVVTAYEDENGVDGYLEMRVTFPSGYYPAEMTKVYRIQRNLPVLKDSFFSYPQAAQPPRIAVLDFRTAGDVRYLLQRRTADLKTSIEDYLSIGGAFQPVSGARVEELLTAYGLEGRWRTEGWRTTPAVKSEVDAIIFGSVEEGPGGIKVDLAGVDYDGEIIGEISRTVSLRELPSLAEDFAATFRRNFPYEGIITSVGDRIQINLGRRQGISEKNKLYSYLVYYDDLRGDFSKKRIAKLKIIDTGESTSVGQVESLTEGYLLEAGGKVKKYRESAVALREFEIVISVSSDGTPVEGANVYLDEHLKGQTDERGEFRLRLEETVSADLSVYKVGYIPASFELVIDGKKNVFDVELKQGQTAFTVSTVPKNALLFIDGEFKGKTPLVRKPIVLPYGFHLVELRKDGYKEFREYMQFDQRRMSFTGSRAIVLYRDYFSAADEAYRRGDIEKAIEILQGVPEDHPDYNRSMIFLGYIHLKDMKDYEGAIRFYNIALDLQSREYREGQPLIDYYNAGQAYYNLAESLFYKDSYQAQYNYHMAISIFKIVRDRRARLSVEKRKTVSQDILFHLAVSNQKLYYLTGYDDYLVQAGNLWVDYFDFFNDDFFRDPYFESQYAVAATFRDEVERIRGER